MVIEKLYRRLQHRSNGSHSDMPISRNLRHLRVFLTVSDVKSLTLASDICSVSQPAVSQTLHKLETEIGGQLFKRTRQGAFPTERGEALAKRVRRAFALLDPVLKTLSPRLPVTATHTQLQALVAVADAENFTLAAKRLGLSQPSIHRAVSQLESECNSTLFERAQHGMIPTKSALALVQATRLAFAEFDQADADLAEFDGRDAGKIVIGALPLSRSAILPKVLAKFRELRPRIAIEINDGPYEDLLTGLRRGAVDVIVGALRTPAPIGDVNQQELFRDYLAFVCAPDHPLAGQKVELSELTNRSWVVPRLGSPSRDQFDAYFKRSDTPRPASIIESGSVLFMREMLLTADFIACVSGAQAQAEIEKGLLARIHVAGNWPGRAIGLTTRTDWEPTKSQSILLDLLRSAAPIENDL